MNPHRKTKKKRREIVPADIITIVGGFLLATIPAVAAKSVISTGAHQTGGFLIAIAFILGAIPSPPARW